MLSVFSSCRDEIAGCSEKGYDSLSISDAKQMLMFSSDQELNQYITEVISIFHFLPPVSDCISLWNRLIFSVDSYNVIYH